MNVRTVILSILALLTTTNSLSQDINVDILKFRTLDGNSYVDVLIEIPGNLCEFSKIDSSYQSENTITVFAEANGNVVAFQKTSLKSPLFTDSLEAVNSTQTHIERLPLKEGVYQVVAKVETKTAHERTLNIQIPLGGTPEISDIAIIEAFSPTIETTTFSRSGFDMIPLVCSDISENATQLKFYSELYNMNQVVGEGELCLLVFGLTDSNGNLSPSHTKYKRINAAQAVPIFESLPVSPTIPSPVNGTLKIEVRTKDGDLIAENSIQIARTEFKEAELQIKDVSFADYWTDVEKLYRHIEDHLPLASPAQQHTIMGILKQNKDLEQMQSFLEQFWIRQNPENPRQAWEAYTAEVIVIDSIFGGCRSGHGADTDMGYVYLKYGRPNTIVKRHHNTNFYPYEIWHYHHTRGMTNKRFLFYAPHVVGECMEILQSDVPGEIHNEDWLQLLRTRENAVKVTESQLNRLNPRDTFSRVEPEDLYYNPR